MPDPVASNVPISEKALWFGFLGSPIAWLLHLVIAYTLAEVVCVADFPAFEVLDLHGGVVLILAVSLLTLLLAVAAGAVAFVSMRKMERHVRKQEVSAERGVGGQMARWGVHLAVLFVFIIGVETIPVFFYLQPCS